MIIAPAIVCGIALFLLVILFSVKHIEVNRGARFGGGNSF
jgi:hypothetical protein